ncbi:hypothetical protein B0T25DRAFT_525089 [Lasiosphaeria hispida]|uniref:Secondary alcohol dehydrogenase n=1 Tax=Lasiosphaeria hispida TaxID=260671 RepID=A0AAJ0HUD3_9PEZI|nr:hypothetical protein B0T25DRAFT_525089 [Lasiosphaeria hispida]
MSAGTLPISPARFAEALTDLSLSSLHLKVLEIRNNIAHLDYSNEQLRPFAEGVADPLGSSPTTTPQPDPDCVEAIRENEAVIARMQARILLVRTEVENRGVSWTEFQSKEEADAAAEAAAAAAAAAAATTNGVALTNGTNGHDNDAAALEGQGQDQQQQQPAPRPTQSHSAWTDGTFQTGVIRGGQVQMDPSPGPRPAAGGSLSDEELRWRMEEQLRGLGDGNEDDEEGGLHL